MARLTHIRLVNHNGTSYEQQQQQQKHGSISFLGFDIIVASFCIVLACFILCFFCVCKQLRMRPPQDQGSGTLEENSFHKCAATWTFAEVDKATDGFSARRLLGRGSYGAVYRAIFPDGPVMAVKRINASHDLRHAGIFSFSEEIRALSRAQHPNIVPLVGYCEAPPAERILVTPLLPGKSLQYHLHEGGMRFDWSQRAKILSEAAQGVEYLHEGTAPYIIHGDIKPSNILLDSTWCARVADFGLAFLAPPNQTFGSLGYIDPEYQTQLNLSKASDVYSFGVVMLEMLSGRPCFGGDIHIVEWAVPLIGGASRGAEIFDPKLAAAAPSVEEPLMRMAKLACRCVNVVRKSRPTISEVVAVLKKIEMDLVAAAIVTPTLSFSAAQSKTHPSHVTLYVA